VSQSPPQPSSKSAPRQGGVIVPHPARWHGRLAARLIYLLVRSIDASLRYRLVDPHHALEEALREPVIFAIWHNRLALSLMLYHRYVRRAQPHRHMAAMVSASKDGGMLARVLELFGVEPVRGSSSRRGAQALLEMTTWAEKGLDLAITPDGPRGPRYVLQDGAVAVAQVTGMAVVPACFRVPWKYQAKSWDRFQIPIPFSRCEVYLGRPLRIPRDASNEEHARLKAEFERRLLEITHD